MLAAAPPDQTVAELSAQRFEVLRHQAALQVESRATHLPTRRQLPPEPQRGYAVLPDPSAGDIFFDLEGDPYVGTDGGIEYLWGWTTADGSYDCRWAHSEHEERVALCEFVQVVQAARAAHPDMHVFHYAAHEKSKLRSLAQKYGVLESAVDAWLRADVLVDLYGVVRQGLQVGEEGYSLKQLERHHAFQRKERSVRAGGGSIIAYESWLKAGEPALLESIRAYNQEDCESTASLYHWLLTRMRPEAAAQYGADFDELAKPADEEAYEGPRWLPEVLALINRLQADFPEQVEDDDAEQAVRRLLGEIVLYHYRESKPQFWSWFDLRAKTPVELVLEREAIGLIESTRRSLSFALEVARHCGAARRSRWTTIADHRASHVAHRRSGLRARDRSGGDAVAAGSRGRDHALRGKLVIAGYHQDGPRQVNMQLWNWRGLDVINAHERDPRALLDGDCARS